MEDIKASEKLDEMEATLIKKMPSLACVDSTEEYLCKAFSIIFVNLEY